LQAFRVGVVIQAPGGQQDLQISQRLMHFLDFGAWLRSRLGHNLWQAGSIRICARANRSSGRLRGLRLCLEELAILKKSHQVFVYRANNRSRAKAY